MKVLVLVQSIDKDGYRELIQTQKETWDAIPHSQVKTVFYFPDPHKEGWFGQDLYVRSNTHYYLMFNHAIEAMRRCLEYEWDYLFKTDNSTYVCKHELVKILQNKPREHYFGGQPYEGPPSPDCNWPFMWGEGIALSRDLVEFLVEFYGTRVPACYYGAEDMFIGRCLMDMPAWDKSLLIYQYWIAKGKVIKSHHVYRCRKDGAEHDFDSTIKSMHHIHHVLSILNNW